MKKRLLTISLVFCSVFILLGQEGTLKATVNMDSVLLGNYIIVTFKVENIPHAKIKAPDFTGFDIVGGPNVSSSMQVINGDVSQSLSQSYWLEPKDVGTFYIPPAQVMNGEVLLESEPMEVNVYHNPDGIVQNPQRTERGHSWFLWPDREVLPKEKTKPKKKRKTYKL